MLVLLIVAFPCISLRFLGTFLAFPWHFLGIFLAFVWYCCEFSQDSYMRPIIFLGFHTFQGPFLVFWRDWMLVLFIVAFPCISWHFFSIFFAFPWHFHSIFHACCWHLLCIVLCLFSIPTYVPLFSKDSIFFELLLRVLQGPDACVAHRRIFMYFSTRFCKFLVFPWHFLGIFLAFPMHILDICLVLLWVFLAFLYMSRNFRRIPYISRFLIRVLQGPDACAAYSCICV